MRSYWLVAVGGPARRTCPCALRPGSAARTVPRSRQLAARGQRFTGLARCGRNRSGSSASRNCGRRKGTSRVDASAYRIEAAGVSGLLRLRPRCSSRTPAAVRTPSRTDRRFLNTTCPKACCGISLSLSWYHVRVLQPWRRCRCGEVRGTVDYDSYAHLSSWQGFPASQNRRSDRCHGRAAVQPGQGSTRCTGCGPPWRAGLWSGVRDVHGPGRGDRGDRPCMGTGRCRGGRRRGRRRGWRRWRGKLPAADRRPHLRWRRRRGCGGKRRRSRRVRRKRRVHPVHVPRHGGHDVRHRRGRRRKPESPRRWRGRRGRRRRSGRQHLHQRSAQRRRRAWRRRRRRHLHARHPGLGARCFCHRGRRRQRRRGRLGSRWARRPRRGERQDRRLRRRGRCRRHIRRSRHRGFGRCGGPRGRSTAPERSRHCPAPPGRQAVRERRAVPVSPAAGERWDGPARANAAEPVDPAEPASPAPSRRRSPPPRPRARVSAETARGAVPAAPGAGEETVAARPPPRIRSPAPRPPRAATATRATPADPATS